MRVQICVATHGCLDAVSAPGDGGNPEVRARHKIVAVKSGTIVGRRTGDGTGFEAIAAAEAYAFIRRNSGVRLNLATDADDFWQSTCCPVLAASCGPLLALLVSGCVS